jgi:hypothetical protein
MAFDEVLRMMGRPFCNVHSLDDVTREIQELGMNLQAQRYDLDMPKILRMLDGPDIGPSPEPQEMKVPVFQRTLPASTSDQISRDPIVLLALEEMRVKMRDYESNVERVADHMKSAHR